MCEVTNKNFEELYNSIEDAFKRSVFISLDCEFSVLCSTVANKISLFDYPEQRYMKMKSSLENAVPMEIGLTAFQFDRDNLVFNAQPYKFYVFPADFGFINSTFTCNSTSFNFLCEHNFNYNKVVYLGISYLNRLQEQELQFHINKGDLYQYCSLSADTFIDDKIRNGCTATSEWFYSKRDQKELILDDVNTNSNLTTYLLHKTLRERFPQDIWTYVEDNKFIIKRVSEKQYITLNESNSLEEELMLDLLGFSRIFKLLVSLKKPVVGHNCINDLLLLINTFHTKLPSSYKSFKELAHTLFPTVYDTKYISFEIRNDIPIDKQWKSNGLQDLYDYFKNETGRHLVPGSPAIEVAAAFKTYTEDKFHDAGWDAYATGYCFIRMLHIIAAKTYISHSKKYFLATEYMRSVEFMKNHVNLIRAATPHLNLAGPDPKSDRPPCLLIESLNNKPINIFKVTELLIEYGSVEIKPHSSHGKTAIAAFASRRSVRRIIGEFRNHCDYKIVTYNPFKHSPIIRVALWGGVLSSSCIVLCLLHHHLFK